MKNNKAIQEWCQRFIDHFAGKGHVEKLGKRKDEQETNTEDSESIR